MAHRLALILALLAAAPVAAQDRELEAGAGMWFLNPLRVLDFEQESIPSANAAWTNWYGERSGWTVGVQALPSLGSGSESALFGHVTWRRRWLHAGDGNFTHLGVGAGPTVWRYDYLHDTSEPWAFSFLWHVEALTTRRIRDGLALRAGVTFTPLLHIPVIVQPVVMVVWSR